MDFKNTCGCIFDTEELQNAIKFACMCKKTKPKDEYKIFLYGKYPAISIRHEKIRVHRIIGEYMIGMQLSGELHVHHIDGNKLNALSNNLQVISKAFHAQTHNFVQYVDKAKLRNNALLGTEKIKRKDITKENVMRLRNKGFTYSQIARELNCGENTVWRRIFE